jgi:hypothetical protein
MIWEAAHVTAETLEIGLWQPTRTPQDDLGFG